MQQQSTSSIQNYPISIPSRSSTPTARASTPLSYRKPYGSIPTRRRRGEGKGSRKGKEKAREDEYGLGAPTVRVRPATSPDQRDSTPVGRRMAPALPPPTSSSSPSRLCYTPASLPLSNFDAEDLCDCDVDPAAADAGSSDFSCAESCLSTASCHRHPSGDLDEPEDEFDISISSSTSSLDSLPSIASSLSPSRVPLFDDSSDTEEDDDDFSFVTPPPLGSYRSSPLSVSARKVPVPTVPTTDPLLSPPSSPVVVALDFTRTTSDRRPSSTAPSDRTLPSGRPRRGVSAASSPSPPAKDSLLTKSLRSLTRLPNLSLPTLPILPTLRVPIVTTLDIDGFSAMDEASPWEWRGSRSVSSSDRGLFAPSSPSTLASLGRDGDGTIRRGRSEAVDDYEAEAMAVQLQTFSAPPPPSPRKKNTVALPSLPLPTPPPNPIISPLLPPTALEPQAPLHPRLISNQRHLLMLSLEIAMMRNGKINCPLRPRAAVIRQPSPGDRAHHSALRWEVRRAVVA